MAERKSKRRRKDLDEKVEPSKEETEIGKHLRWNCPVKNSTIMGQKVEYFIASKAVDCLLDSKWASGKGGTEIRFTDRASVVTYLQRLLELEFFYRVHRIKKKKGDGKEKEKGKGKEKEKEPEKGKVKEKEVEKETEKTKEDTDGKKSKKKEKKSKEEESKNKDETEGKKKRKVKVKLEMHEEQIFLDGDDQAYAWIFDPVHPKTFVMGILVVIASIAICMFPLWPMNVREYVWYLSVAGAVAIGLLLLLGVVRYVMFSVLWALSFGKHHFWLLPNLYAECGFFESFVPLYEYEYKGAKDETDKEKSGDKSGKEDEDEEEQNEKQNDFQNENENENRNETDKIKDKDSSSDDKESTDGGMRDSWVKLTEEEVENARTEVETMEKDIDSSECKEVKC